MMTVTATNSGLEGVKVCMLVTNDTRRDSRVRKEAASAARAGAEVVVVGVGRDAPDELSGYRLVLVPPMVASELRFWPARVIDNLLRERRHRLRMQRAAIAEKADLYHANDLDTLRQGMAASRRLCVPLVYDAHELSTEAGTMKLWERTLSRRAERRGIRHASEVVTVNNGIARELATRYGVALPTVVYNGGAMRVTEPSRTSSPVRILFQGQFFADRGLPELIDAMPCLRGRAILTLQGWGGIESELRQQVSELGLQDVVTFAPPCDPMRVVEEAARHDIGVINHRPLSLNHLLASPNKLFDYICAGLAIVAPDYPVFREILEDAGCGILFDQERVGSLGEALVQLVEEPTVVDRLKRSAVDSSERYLWSVQAEGLIAAYRTALGREEPS